MFRCLIIAGAASLALLGATAQAASPVQLLDAGATPMDTLRYRFKTGSSEGATMDMNMQLALSLGGQQMPMAAIPPLRMVMRMRVADVAADGSAKLEFELVSAEATGDPAQAAAVNQSLAGMKGLAGWYRMDTRGQISEGGAGTPAGQASNEAATSMLNDLEQSLQQLAAPFPAEPVGAGARWQVTQQANSGGMKLTQTVEYTLRARQGNRISLDVKMIDAKVDASGGLPAGTRLESVTVAGGGTTSVDLDRLMPTASIEGDTKVSISGSVAGQEQKMDMNLKVRQSIAPSAN